MKQIPNTMRAIYLEKFGDLLQVKQLPIPQPGEGQLLVKMEASPINPSDQLFLQGFYQTTKTCPCIPGFEGAGTVVLSGGGVIGWSLVGKRVAIYTQNQFGCWGEYAICEATQCIEMDEFHTFEEAATTFVNPLTIMAMYDTCKQYKVNAVINTAASSQLGKMMIRYFQANGIRVINIVRKKEHIDTLKQIGGDLILNQNDEDFLDKLRSMAKTLDARILFDAVGGELTGKILNEMPYNSTAYVYGLLSGQPIQNISCSGLIFQKKKVQGFWITDWIRGKNLLSQVLFLKKLKSQLQGQLKTEIQEKFQLEEFQQALEKSTQNSSQGKALFMVQKRDQQDQLQENQSDQ